MREERWWGVVKRVHLGGAPPWGEPKSLHGGLGEVSWCCVTVRLRVHYASLTREGWPVR